MNEIRNNFYKVLKNNKEVVDKYLKIEYNMSAERLVIADDPEERGKAQYLRSLINILRTK